MDISAEIRDLYRKDKREAFRLLFDTCREGLFLFSLGLVHDISAAEDVVQDCFADFWANDRMKNISEDTVKYLMGAVYHASLNHLRRNKRREALHEKFGTEDQGAPSEPDPEYVRRMGRIYEAVGELPQERRRIFLMIVVEGMKYQAVADRLGISINTVKTQMKRAVGALREAFGES